MKENKSIIIVDKQDNKLYEVKRASVTLQGYEITSKVELYVEEYSTGEYNYIKLDELVDNFYVEDYAMKRILFLIDELIEQQEF